MRALRAEGVRTDFIIRGGDRVGVYYVEAGASQRASKSSTPRPSAISELEPGTVDWPKVLRGQTGFTCPVSRRRSAKRRQHARVSRSTPRRESALRCLSIELPKEVWTEAQAQRRCVRSSARSISRSQTRRTCNRCSASKCPNTGCHIGPSECGRLQEVAERLTSVWAAACCDHAPRKRVGERQRLERGVLGRESRPLYEPALRCARGRSNRRGRQFRRRPHLRAAHGSGSRGMAAICRRIQRAEADDSRRLQPAVRRRSRSPREKETRLAASSDRIFVYEHPSDYRRELHRPQHSVETRTNDGGRTRQNGGEISSLRPHHSASGRRAIRFDTAGPRDQPGRPQRRCPDNRGSRSELGRYDAISFPRDSWIEVVPGSTGCDIAEMSPPVVKRHPVQFVAFSDVRDPGLHFAAGGPGTSAELNILIGKNIEAGRLMRE